MAIVRHVLDYNRAGIDDAVRTDRKPGHNDRSGADDTVLSDVSVAVYPAGHIMGENGRFVFDNNALPDVDASRESAVNVSASCDPHIARNFHPPHVFAHKAVPALTHGLWPIGARFLL